MAPLQTRGVKKVWTPERVIKVIQRWNALYGAPPKAADLNPSSARWSAQEWRIERYRKGDPETGEPWPCLNAVKEVFDGSLNKAVRAAGLEPGRPGPPRRTNVNLDHARQGLPPDGRVALDGLRARVAELEALLDRRDREVERLRGVSRDRPVKHVPVIRERVRTEKIRVVDHAAVRRAEKTASEALSAVAKAREALRAAELEARAEIRRIGLIVGRRDAALIRAREDRKELTEKRRVLERRLAHAISSPVVREVERTRVVEKLVPAPEAVELERMRMERDQALRHARNAEDQAARSDAEYMKLATAATGDTRRLTPAEMRALAERGPAGPALVADALRKLARARKTDRPDLLGDALLRLAAAAVSWRERL